MHIYAHICTYIPGGAERHGQPSWYMMSLCSRDVASPPCVYMHIYTYIYIYIRIYIYIYMYIYIYLVHDVIVLA